MITNLLMFPREILFYGYYWLRRDLAANVIMFVISSFVNLRIVFGVLPSNLISRVVFEGNQRAFLQA